MTIHYKLETGSKIGKAVFDQPFFVADNNKEIRLVLDCEGNEVLLVNLSNGFETASLVAKNKVVDVPSRLVIEGQLRGNVMNGKKVKWTLEPISIVQCNDAFGGYSAFDELARTVSALANDVRVIMDTMEQFEEESEQATHDAAEAHKLSSDAVRTAQAAAEAVKQLSDLIKEDISK